jgi:hypothetical protein
MSGVIQMNPVTVFRSFNPAEADVVRSRLEAAEFLVTLAHDQAALGLEGGPLAAGGILVQVPEEEAEEARALLASAE